MARWRNTPTPGTFLRTVVIDSYAAGFLKANGRCQIVSLGAGFCTRFFRLLEENSFRGEKLYYEVDFPEVLQLKAKVFQASTDTPRWVGLDLANGQSAERLCAAIQHAIPTLIIAECFFPYLAEEDGRQFLQKLSERLDFELISFDFAFNCCTSPFAKQLKVSLGEVLLNEKGVPVPNSTPSERFTLLHAYSDRIAIEEKQR